MVTSKRSQVSISRCGSYDPGEVRAALRSCLASIGGMERYVPEGGRVLIKPNLLLAKDPKHAITTHPSVVRAIIEEVRNCGGVPLIGDSPGSVLKGVERVWSKTGMKELAAELDVELLNFEKGGALQKSVRGRTYPISSHVLDADVLINVPKLKTHNLTRYTGAIKNLLGCLPGFTKANLHKKHVNPRSLSRALVDIFELVRPRLNVMDGVTGMDGEGPSTKGRLRNFGVILASEDAVSLDAVSARIIGFGKNDVDMICFAGELDLGQDDPDGIEILGGALTEFVSNNPLLPSVWKFMLVPDRIGRLLGRIIWLRPIVDLQRCAGCFQCVASCPVTAISVREGQRLVFDYGKCINCLCCQEMCPEGAVTQQRSLVTRLIYRSL